jgi:hypothetical protein
MICHAAIQFLSHHLWLDFWAHTKSNIDDPVFCPHPSSTQVGSAYASGGAVASFGLSDLDKPCPSPHRIAFPVFFLASHDMTHISIPACHPSPHLYTSCSVPPVGHPHLPRNFGLIRYSCPYRPFFMRHRRRLHLCNTHR